MKNLALYAVLFFSSLFFSIAQAQQQCRLILADLGFESEKILRDLEQTHDTKEFKSKIVSLAIARARAEAVRLLSRDKERLDTLRSALEESRKCGSKIQCLLIQEKRAETGFKLLLQVFRATRKSESQVREFLLEAAATRPELLKRLQDHYNERHFSWNNLWARFAELPQLFKFENLREKGEVGDETRRHFFRSTGIALAFQVGAHTYNDIIPKYLSDPSFSFVRDTEWGVPPNTVLMMALQA